MKTVMITASNTKPVDATDWGVIGEFAAIPDWIVVNESEGTKAIIRKHGPNSLRIGKVEVRLICDESPEAALEEARAEMQSEGISEDNVSWWLEIF